jgi:prophage regulatory protein
MNDFAILRLPAVTQETGRGRSSLYNDVSAGLMTKPVAIGGNAVGWPAGEIRAINQARIAGRTDNEIRALVQQLHEARKVAA